MRNEAEQISSFRGVFGTGGWIFQAPVFHAISRRLAHGLLRAGEIRTQVYAAQRKSDEDKAKPEETTQDEKHDPQIGVKTS